MKTREQKIEAIYDKVADKTLSRGCKFIHDGIEFIYSGNTDSDETILESIESGDTKIIGHTIYIGDVLDYTEKNNIHYVGNSWKEKRKSLEEQSTECIDFIYNLLLLGTEKN